MAVLPAPLSMTGRAARWCSMSRRSLGNLVSRCPTVHIVFSVQEEFNLRAR